MRLAVIGAGVVGVTTAYELACDGHEVTVFERGNTAAEGASFANLGLLAPTWIAAQFSAQWQHDQPSGVGAWWHRLRRARPTPDTDPGTALLDLANLGTRRLDDLCNALQLSVDSHRGMVVVWREAREDKRAEDLIAHVRAAGGTCHLMPAEQVREQGSVLSHNTPLQGALVMPDVWSVNCRQFTLLLRAQAQQRGCRFEFGHTVKAIETGSDIRVFSDKAPQGTDRFDGVVLCAGAASSGLLRPLGVRLPLSDWVGPSLSAAANEPLEALLAVVHDLQHRVSIARMGHRIRVSGPAERVGRSAPATQDFKTLYAVLNDWFPGAIRYGSAAGIQEWSARVSAPPDNLPVIGASGHPGVWINTGHGMHGWVTACASARLLADSVAGQGSEIDPTPYRTTRWAHGSR